MAEPETTPDFPHWNPKKPILGARINPLFNFEWRRTRRVVDGYVEDWIVAIEFPGERPAGSAFRDPAQAPIFRVRELCGCRSELARVKNERSASLAPDLVASTSGIHCCKHERIPLYLLEHKPVRGSQFCFQHETAIDICEFCCPKRFARNLKSVQITNRNRASVNVNYFYACFSPSYYLVVAQFPITRPKEPACLKQLSRAGIHR